MVKKCVFPVFIALALMLSSLGTGILSAKSITDEQQRAVKAAEVLTEVMQAPDQGIPNELMERAEAIAVFPHVVKGAFGVGGEYGRGMVSQRMANGRWSAPAYIKIGGGSFGFQIGASSTDIVLVFTDRKGYEGLLSGKVKLGADAAVAAGPVGRNAQVGTDIKLESPVFAYSRSKGLFAGIALDGAVVTIDDSANQLVYGRAMSGREILTEGRAPINNIVAPFVQALNRYSPAHHRTT
jgi:lipid-binding SYLF domain-containing protein